MNSRFVLLVGFVALVWSGLAAPKPADSIPVFANGQAASCDLCHTAPPNLNAYGRYVLATNFAKGLDAEAQMHENLRDPASFEITGNGSNTPVPDVPNVNVGLAQFMSAGFLGKDVTYYATVPVVEGSFPASAVDQVWAAYNGLSNGNGSLQVGKFTTPVFTPWLSQSLSLAGYSLGAGPVGLNTVGIGDNRWGASYTQIGGKALIANVAYVTNTGPFERAYNSNVNDTTSGAEGQAYVASLQYMGLGSHFTGGLAAMGGTFPLPSGAQDAYNRSMALLSYSSSPKYDVVAMALVGHDANPNDGASPASASNGWSLEMIYGPFTWLHLDTRYERTNDGLGTMQNNYVGDIAISLMPNLVLTLENASSVGARPVLSYQLFWAGPWIQHPVAQVAEATSNPQALQSGQQVYAANCAVCHGATGNGGVGPNLHQVATTKTFAQTVAFIENPTGGMPKLYPSKLTDQQVRDVATYVRTTFK